MREVTELVHGAHVITRRSFVRRVVSGGAVLFALPLLDACGGSAPAATAAPTSAAPTSPAAATASATQAAAPTTVATAAAAPTTNVAPTPQPAPATVAKTVIRLSPGSQPDFAPNDPYLVYWLKPYLAEHPNVTLKTQGYGSEPETKLLTELVAGTPVNIWLTTRWGTLGRAVELKAVEDLTGPIRTWDYSEYKPAVLRVGQIQGKQWAMPYGDVCDTFLTRKAAFEQGSSKIGFDPNKAYQGTWTWEDNFDAVMMALSAPPSKYGLGLMGSSKNNIARWWFQVMTQSWGYDIVADDGKGGLAATFVNPGTIAVAKMYQQAIKTKFAPRASVTWGFSSAENAWFAGTVETIIAGRWIKQLAIKNVKNDFVALTVPVSKTRPKDSWYGGNTHLSFILKPGIKDAATMQTCLDMVKSLVSKTVQEGLSKSGAVPFPVRLDINPETLYNEPYWPGMLNAFKTKTPPPTFPDSPKLEDVYTECAKAVGQILAQPNGNAQAILQSAQQKAELVLTS